MKFTLPKVTALISFFGGMVASGDVYAQDVVSLQHKVAPAAPDFLAYLMPIIIGSVSAGGTAIAAWLIKTIVGMSVEAFCTLGETWATEKLKKALADKDPNNDIPAMAFTKAVLATCKKLREAEKLFPGKKE